MNNLYDESDLRIMRATEESWSRGVNRVHEIKNFARETKAKRIGLAHCISFPKEADAVKEFLGDEFEVFTVNCKCGRVTQNEIMGNNSASISCNPAGQAEFLKNHKTDLNISMGLCVGHDMIFNQKSSAPVTTLIVKDQVSRPVLKVTDEMINKPRL